MEDFKEIYKQNMKIVEKEVFSSDLKGKIRVFFANCCLDDKQKAELSDILKEVAFNLPF